MVKPLKQQQREIAKINANWLARPQKDTKPKAKRPSEWNRYSTPLPRRVTDDYE